MLIGPATAVLQPSFFTPMSSRQFLRRQVSNTPSKINPQSIASLAAASAAAKIDTKPMDSTVPATSPAAATDKKAVAEAAAVTDHPTSASPTRINNVRTARLYTLGTYSPSAPHPTHAPPSCLLSSPCNAYRP